MEAPYLRALETRGAGTARDVLRPHLDAPSPVVMRQAALHLGALGDPLAAPTLIAILPRHPHDQDLLAALAFTLCVDFRSTPDPAGVYAAWWRDNGRKDPTHWLARSIVHHGLPIPDGFGTPEPPPLAETVPALLTLLQTGPAFLRPAITYHLNVLTGVDAPALRVRTPVPMVRQVAQVWQEWLDARAEG